jgi:oxygen-dependent protoporphyrinogen oxidase
MPIQPVRDEAQNISGNLTGSGQGNTVIFIGAGISGLTAAYRLQQRLPDATITVLEQNPRTGGTIRTEQHDGFRLEAGPNGFLDSKPSTRELCQDLGLGDQLIQASESSGKNRYLFLGDGLKRLPSSLGSFLTSDLLSWRGKISLLMERFRARGPDLPDESIDGFARRRAGTEVAELFADAIVTGIFAGDPKLLSVRAAFPRMVELEHEYGSIIGGMIQSAKKRRREAEMRGEVYQRGGKLWSFRQGLSLLIDTLTAKLKQPPLLGATVRRIAPGQSDTGKPIWNVFADQDRSWSADAVVLTCPAHQQAAIVSDLDGELARQMIDIPYNRVAVVGLGYRQADVPPVDGFGFIAPQKNRRDILGVQWCSSIYPDRAPNGNVLLRAMCGGWHRPDAAALADDLLLGAMREELRLAMKISAAPVFTHIVRWERAIPQYHLGHLERVRKIEAVVSRYPGLFVGGNAYHGVALNDCTEQGKVMAEQVREYLV